MAVKSLKRSSVKSTQKTNAMNAGYNFQDYELIESVFLSASASSVVFSNLDKYAIEYKHLELRTVAKSNRSGNNEDNLTARFNGDAGANYSRHAILVTSASPGVVTSSSFTPDSYISFSRLATTNSGAAEAFSASVVQILDAFSNSKNKTAKVFTGFVSNTHNVIRLESGSWQNLSPISSITLSTQFGPLLLAGSRFSLYGIR